MYNETAKACICLPNIRMILRIEPRDVLTKPRENRFPGVEVVPSQCVGSRCNDRQEKYTYFKAALQSEQIDVNIYVFYLNLFIEYSKLLKGVTFWVKIALYIRKHRAKFHEYISIQFKEIQILLNAIKFPACQVKEKILKKMYKPFLSFCF